jgi:hypothetical protein
MYLGTQNFNLIKMRLCHGNTRVKLYQNLSKDSEFEKLINYNMP